MAFPGFTGACGVEMPIPRNIMGIAKRSAAAILNRRWILERAKYFPSVILSPRLGNQRLGELLQSRHSMAAGKMGNVELGGLRHYMRYREDLDFCGTWGRHARLLYLNAGVYPATEEVLSRFCATYGESLSSLDVLGVWFQPGEDRVRRAFAPRATPISLTALEPFFHDDPWSRHLAGKRVLVITPFADTVQSQYKRRTEIWSGRNDVLPEFELATIRCPLSAGIVDPIFPDWFSALDSMRDEMARRVFDVAIIGAGAWGIPLASHAKKLGRSAIHLGGPTQILFGIRGARWDHHPVIRNFMNDAWVRPVGTDRPDSFRLIEDGCYW